MMVNPAFLLNHIGELVAFLALIMIGKWAINTVLGVVLHAGFSPSLTIAAGLSQIGEFSFLIGQTGAAFGVLSRDQYSLILGAAVLSIACNTFVFKARGPIGQALGPRADHHGSLWRGIEPRVRGCVQLHSKRGR